MDLRQPFSVGDPRDPRPDDARFPSRQAAESFARDKSFPNIVLAVWHNVSGTVVAIAFDGLIYWP